MKNFLKNQKKTVDLNVLAEPSRRWSKREEEIIINAVKRCRFKNYWDRFWISKPSKPSKIQQASKLFIRKQFLKERNFAR